MLNVKTLYIHAKHTLLIYIVFEFSILETEFFAWIFMSVESVFVFKFLCFLIFYSKKLFET